MGFGGIGIWQLLIILAIVVLLFGTKRLSGIGSDLGKAIKGFKKSVKDDDEDRDDKNPDEAIERNVEDNTDSVHHAQKEKASTDEKPGQ